MKARTLFLILGLAQFLVACATVRETDGLQCNPPSDDVVVRLVQALSSSEVNRVSPVPVDLALQFQCDGTSPLQDCVLGVHEGDEDFKSSRIAMYHQESNTLITAEGRDDEYVVTRIGFENECVSLATGRPLHMASEVDQQTLEQVFRSPDHLYNLPNLLEGDGFIATLAKDSGLYLEFARNWASALLDDLSELIQLK